MHFIRTNRHASAIITAALLVVIGVIVGVTRHDPGNKPGVQLRADQQSLQPSPTVTVPSDVIPHTPAGGSADANGLPPLMTLGNLNAPVRAPASSGHSSGHTSTGSTDASPATTEPHGSGGATSTTLAGSSNAFVPGRIAYSAGGAVWTINPDGTGARSVVSPGFFPAWSPDHSAIAYADADGSGGGLHIASASGDFRLTTGVAADSEPVWSPDGKKIAFGRIDKSQAVQQSEIWTIDRNGANLRRLTQLACLNRDPTWSPDGKTIVFWSSSADCTNGNYALYNLDVASGAVTPFTPPNNANSGGPAWSPDGKTIAFASDGYGGVGFEICLMNPDGSNAGAITNLSGNDTEPAWSPDAKQIVYTRDSGIFVMNANGSNRTLLVSGAIEPAWY